jgi:hypothetical protein
VPTKIIRRQPTNEHYPCVTTKAAANYFDCGSATGI